MIERINIVTLKILLDRCKPGEPGEFVAKIVDQHPVRGFPGYVNNNATKNKIIRHVWSKDDQCFKSGDILVTDKYGWFYYIDRIGDTFRWKGENVSTAEVESVINSFDSSMIQACYIRCLNFQTL